MATARLRLFPYPEDEPEDATTPSIPIRLSDLYPLLAQAYRDNYVWLQRLRRRSPDGQQRSLRGDPGVLELSTLGLSLATRSRDAGSHGGVVRQVV